MMKRMHLLFLGGLLFWGTHVQAAFYYGLRGNVGIMEAEPSGLKKNYTEAEILVEYKLSQPFSLQGSVFSRFVNSETYFGAQIVMPLRAFLPGSFLSSYIAPGYRYMNKGHSAPILEGGLNMYFLGNIGLGYRFIFNEWVGNGLKTEGQFFATVYF